MSNAFPASDGNAPSSSLWTSASMLSSTFRSDMDEGEIDSLPSGPASDSSLEADLSPYDSDDDDESDAEEEWRESMHQLELLLTMVLIPFVGKFLGRKCAYWGWGKFMEWKYSAEVTVGNNWLSRRPTKQATLVSL